MKKLFLLAAAAIPLSLALPVNAEPNAQDTEKEAPPSISEIVDSAPASEWMKIAPENLLVMTLASDAEGNARKVVIQLMPAPFSQGWVSNIRTFARAKWYDNISVNRVQDNYVVQWGDPNYDNPEATGKPKPLPAGLKVMEEGEYITAFEPELLKKIWGSTGQRPAIERIVPVPQSVWEPRFRRPDDFSDSYSEAVGFYGGFPIAMTLADWRRARVSQPENLWPTHCYGMVGVGRNYSPDTGSGAELYTIIGHAPRHLDRNIALVGRIVEGMEHLSSLPRGKGAMGFYRQDEVGKRTPILSVRVASDLPEAEQPRFEYLDTDGDAFTAYVKARANRHDKFFIAPAGGADICNIPVPVRKVAE